MVLEECILCLCVCRGGTAVFLLMDTCQGTIRVRIMVRMTHENNIVGTYPDAHRRERFRSNLVGRCIITHIQITWKRHESLEVEERRKKGKSLQS